MYSAWAITQNQLKAQARRKPKQCLVTTAGTKSALGSAAASASVRSLSKQNFLHQKGKCPFFPPAAEVY